MQSVKMIPWPKIWNHEMARNSLRNRKDTLPICVGAEFIC